MAKKGSPVKRKSLAALFWIAVFAVTGLLVFVAPLFSTTPVRTTWSEFENKMLKRGVVEKVIVVDKEVAQIYINKDMAGDSVFRKVMHSSFGVNPGPHYILNIGSVDVFENKIRTAQEDLPPNKRVEVIYEQASGWSIYTWLIPGLLIVLTIRFLMSQRTDGMGPGSMFGFGKSTARLTDVDGKSKITFDQVAGLEEAKTEIKEIVDFLKDSSRYEKLGAKIPKGVIIVGPPGTGKTLLAKAVAGEAQVPFFSLSGSEFVEMFVGVGASRVRDLFKRAKESASCIVFIDEIDAVGRSRGRNAMYSGSNDERESTLNQLLTEMDGFGTNSGVIVLAATNRADVLDPALLRPGRFDRHIYLELPNEAERKQIFEVHLKPIVLSKDVDTQNLARQTPGFSGADIANICNESALIAARKKEQEVTAQDLQDAIDRVVAGLEKKSKIISINEKKTIAIHESGHAIISWLLEKVDPLVKVSIIPRGKSLGAAWYLPSERNIESYTYYEQKLVATLGGRAAEEVIFGEISSGALDDLEKSTKEAYTMIAYLGFNKKVGMVSYFDSSGRSEYSLQKPYSEQTARMIDEEVRSLLEQCYNRAKQILSDHKKELIEMANLLIQKEIIQRDDINRILGDRPGKPLPEIRELTTVM